MNDAQALVARVAEAERERFEAVVADDVDSLAALCDPRLRYTHSNGHTDDLASYLDKCRQGVWDFHHIAHPVSTIEVIGDSALVFGEMHAELTTAGAEKELHMRTLSVWADGPGGTRLVAFQPTPLAG